jgi:hypothetical protein
LDEGFWLGDDGLEGRVKGRYEFSKEAASRNRYQRKDDLFCVINIEVVSY